MQVSLCDTIHLICVHVTHLFLRSNENNFSPVSIHIVEKSVFHDGALWLFISSFADCWIFFSDDLVE